MGSNHNRRHIRRRNPVVNFELWLTIYTDTLFEVVLTLHFALDFRIADVTPHLLVAVLPVGVQTSDRGERHLALLTSRHVFVVFMFRLFVATLSLSCSFFFGLTVLLVLLMHVCW